MQETTYHQLADLIFNQLEAALEELDAEGSLELEIIGGVMNIVLESGKTFVVSKHQPTGQIWLSSPLSGGLHFSYKDGKWQLADGRELAALLAKELREMADIHVTF
ncbi:MAG: iron donor protein CyaY [Rickettsiales bacterium]|jgi:iron donor protein CyaY|nr:iron donor protein CyaY [Rickettsiales bacterium]